MLMLMLMPAYAYVYAYAYALVKTSLYSQRIEDYSRHLSPRHLAKQLVSLR